MSFLATGKVNYRARIDRAELLAERYPFADKILVFYGHLAGFQKELYEQLPKIWGKRAVAPASGDLRAELNLDILLESFDRFLSLIESKAPGPLAAEARQLRKQGEREWSSVLTEYWRTGLRETASSGVLQEFLVRAFLQPCAEFIVGAM